MYDIIIIGGGPAGLTAGLYAARSGKKTALFERISIGGVAVTAQKIKNYPGFDQISGFDLAQKIEAQAKSFGMEIVYDTVDRVDLIKKEILCQKGTHQFKSVILCMGADDIKLNLPNEQRLVGRGISYCATCDGAFFKNLEVAVVGEGNTAAAYALYLAGLAKKVYFVCRNERPDVLPKMLEKINSEPKIEKLFYTDIAKINGQTKLESIVLKSFDKEYEQKIEGLFVAIGHAPDASIVCQKLPLDQKGYIITDEDMSIKGFEGVYAAGDIRSKTLRQIITACSDGAIAGENAAKYCNTSG